MRIKNISNFTTCRWKKFFLDITRKAKTKNAFRFYFKIFGRKTIFWITNVSTWVSSYNRPIFSFVMFAYRDMCLQFHMEDRRRTCECHQFLPTKTNTLMDLIIELEKKSINIFLCFENDCRGLEKNGRFNKVIFHFFVPVICTFTVINLLILWWVQYLLRIAFIFLNHRTFPNRGRRHRTDQCSG